MAELIPYKKIIVDRSDRGEIYTVKQRFSERITRENLEGVQARLDSEGNTILYVDQKYLEDPAIERLIEHTLEGLTRDLKSKTTTIQVSELLLPESLEEAYHSAELARGDTQAARTENVTLVKEKELLQVQMTTAELESEGKLEGLEAQLATAQSTYQELQRTYQELETQHTALLQEQHPKKRRQRQEQKLQPQPTTIQELTETLAYNFRLHQEQQEQLIAPFLYRARDAIQHYAPYEKQPEVDAARVVLEGKKQFEALATQTGKTLEGILKNLPNEVRTTTLSSWADAEKKVQAYQSALEHREFILPIRIAKHERSTTIIFPIDPESKQGIHPQLYKQLQGYQESIQPKHTMAAWLRPENGLSIITIQGQPSNEDLKEEVTTTLHLKDTKITPYFIETRYFQGLPPREEPEQEPEPETVHDLLVAAIERKGHASQADFCKAVGFPRNFIAKFKGHQVHKMARQTIAKLTESLGISEEELRSRFVRH